MAFSHGSNARAYLNGYNVSPYLNSFAENVDIDSAETSAFSSTYKTFIPGLINATVSADGRFDGGATAIDYIFATAVQNGVDDLFVWMEQGDNFGSPARGIQAVTTNYTVTTSISDVASVTFAATSDKGLDACNVLMPLGAWASNSSSSSIDNGAATSNGGVAYLTVVTATSLAVTIQSSPDNSTWSTVTGLVFSSTSTQGCTRLVSLGVSVGRYVRATWTGSASSAQLIFGRK